MVRVGFILLDKKRPRVLTPVLRAAAEQHGIQLVALNPCDTEQWAQQALDVIVHKVPEDHGLDARLLAFQARHPQLLLVDPPAAVRALQHREAMLAPLAGQPLLLQQGARCIACAVCQRQQQQAPMQQHHGQQQRNQQDPQQQQQEQQQLTDTCIISVPAQTTLQPGCSSQQAMQQLHAAGITFPALVKPLSSTPSDTPSAAAAAGHLDGHALGALYSEQGLQQLLQGAVPELALPVVVQQFVPHGPALYKLYVMGPHVVLTRRSTLTAEKLQAAAAAAAAAAAVAAAEKQQGVAVAGEPGVVLLQRVSAVPLPAPAGSASGAEISQHVPPPAAACRGAQEQQCSVHDRQQQQQQIAADAGSCDCSSAVSSACISHERWQQMGVGQSGDTGLCCPCGCCGGTGIADPSVAGDDAAPPLWAMKQLAAYLRRKLQLNLFNVDIIAPEEPLAQHGTAAGVSAQTEQQEQQHMEGQKGTSSLPSTGGCNSRRFLVVDVNFFPGFDKVPGAEQLFADYLASLKS